MSVLASTLTRLDAATDGQLLGRFVQTRDADAFAALVRRLGPTVLGVCRRVCPDAHLADDAFQAAFLVLATKAESVRPREQVAVWLHGVAYRTASKARAMLANRRRRESALPTLSDPPAHDAAVPDDDELRKLDAAIAALPDHLRAAVVLCELEGRSRKEAAKQLGIPEGTLSSRLADARKRLGERLRPTTAVVTAALVASTAEAALGGSTSETVRSLARGVMSMLLLNKLKVPAAVLVVVAVLSGVAFASDPPKEDPPKVREPGVKADKPPMAWKLKKEDILYVTIEMAIEKQLLPPPPAKPPAAAIGRTSDVWKLTVLSAGADGTAVEVEPVWCKSGDGGEAKAIKFTAAPDLAGKKFLVAFDADFRVKKVEDAAKFDAAVVAAAGQGVMVADPSAAAVALRLEQLFQLLPGKWVAAGDEWERTHEGSQDGGRLRTKWVRRAKLDEWADGVAKVTTQVNHSLQTDPEVKNPPAVLKLNGEKCGGSFEFDRRLGRLTKAEETITLNGMGTTGGGTLGMRIVSKTTTSVSAKPPKDE